MGSLIELLTENLIFTWEIDFTIEFVYIFFKFMIIGSLFYQISHDIGSLFYWIHRFMGLLFYWNHWILSPLDS